jgi:divalent metal cation (Fe/Co/Zn/Cd) transporter
VKPSVRRAGRRTEAKVTLIDAGLAGALLIGLLLNTALGWGWADPLIALVLAALAVEEGLEGVRGEGTS